MSSDWTIPGRNPDWPPLEPTDPDRARELARHCYWAGDDAMGDAFLAEAEAVENGDEDAWRDAVDAQGRALVPPGPLSPRDEGDPR